MRTRKTGPDDIPALKALWVQAFGDTDAEIDSFFKTVYPEATGFCAEEDGAVIAMLFALPVTLAILCLMEHFSIHKEVKT